MSTIAAYVDTDTVAARQASETSHLINIEL